MTHSLSRRFSTLTLRRGSPQESLHQVRITFIVARSRCFSASNRVMFIVVGFNLRRSPDLKYPPPCIQPLHCTLIASYGCTFPILRPCSCSLTTTHGTSIDRETPATIAGPIESCAPPPSVPRSTPRLPRSPPARPLPALLRPPLAPFMMQSGKPAAAAARKPGAGASKSKAAKKKCVDWLEVCLRVADGRLTRGVWSAGRRRRSPRRRHRRRPPQWRPRPGPHGPTRAARPPSPARPTPRQASGRRPRVRPQPLAAALAVRPTARDRCGWIAGADRTLVADSWHGLRPRRRAPEAAAAPRAVRVPLPCGAVTRRFVPIVEAADAHDAWVNDRARRWTWSWRTARATPACWTASTRTTSRSCSRALGAWCVAVLAAADAVMTREREREN